MVMDKLNSLSLEKILLSLKRGRINKMRPHRKKEAKIKTPYNNKLLLRLLLLLVKIINQRKGKPNLLQKEVIRILKYLLNNKRSLLEKAASFLRITIPSQHKTVG